MMSLNEISFTDRSIEGVGGLHVDIGLFGCGFGPHGGDVGRFGVSEMRGKLGKP